MGKKVRKVLCSINQNMTGFKGVSVLFQPVENPNSLGVCCTVMESEQHWVEQTANKLHGVVGYSHCFGSSSGLLHPCSWLEQLPGPWVRAAVQAALRSDWSHADSQSRDGDSNCKVVKCHPASKEQWEWEDAQGLMAMMQCCRSAGGNCSSSQPWSLQLLGTDLQLLPALTLLLEEQDPNA